jgi:hypothetical protein
MKHTIPEQPLEPAIYSEGALHPMRKSASGLVMGPTNTALYLGLGCSPLIFIAWYFTKDLDIAPGLKLAAWLFPVFATVGLFVAWALTHILASRFVFNTVLRRVEFHGLRFRGQAPIPFAHLVAVQTCYGGEKTFGESGRHHKVDVYELNLVLRQNGPIERLNLVCHGEGGPLVKQGRQIAELVGVPFVTAGPVPNVGDSP